MSDSENSDDGFEGDAPSNTETQNENEASLDEQEHTEGTEGAASTDAEPSVFDSETAEDENPLAPIDELDAAASRPEFHDALFEAFIRTVDPEVRTLRGALVEAGVNFNEADGGGAFRTLSAGNAGAYFTNTEVATHYRADTLDGGFDRRTGHAFSSNASMSPRYSVLDTTMIRRLLEEAVPDHAQDLAQAYLDRFYPLDPEAPDGVIQGDEGVGGNTRELARKLVEEPSALAWIVDMLTSAGFTIQRINAGSGGGTGGGVLDMQSALARRGILGGPDDLLVVQYTTSRIGYATNARYLDDGTPVTTWDEQMSFQRRLGEDLANPDISNCGIHMENDGLAVHEFLSETQASLNQIHSWLADVREGDVLRFARDLMYNPEVASYRDHTEMNYAERDLIFFPSQALMRHAKAQFIAGNEQWDENEMVNDLAGLSWSLGMVGTEAYDEVSERDPKIETVDTVGDLLFGLTRLCAPKLASTVSYDEIKRALVFVYAPQEAVGLDALSMVEDIVADTYALAGSREDTVRAFEVRGFEPEELPGDDDLARVQIMAGHDVPLQSFRKRDTQEFVEEVQK